MKNAVLLALSLFVFASCTHKKAPAKLNPVSVKTKATTVDSAFDSYSYIAFDTTITPFTDKSYLLKLHTIDRHVSRSDYNTLFTFEHSHDGKAEQLLRDSLYCFNDRPEITFRDMNNDKVPDMIITYEMSGGNSNMIYHLYLCDTGKHRLIRVKGFEDIYNPVLKSKYNIIESLVLSGTDYYTFHRINSKNKLIDLGHSFYVRREACDTNKMDRKYSNAIKRIARAHKD